MKNTIIKLALDDVFRNRKRTVVQIMIIALSAALFFFTVISLPYFVQLYRQYCHETYGDWYAYADIPDEGYDLYRYEIEKKDRFGGLTDFGLKMEGATEPTEDDILRYGFLYKQGVSDHFIIGHTDESLYDLCRLDLIEGTYPIKHEVMITQEVSEEYRCFIGDQLLLEVNGMKDMYTVSGIIHKSQDLFPDIYTNEESGDAYVFFDRHFGQYAEDGKYVISHFGFSLEYVENRYGYDHFTRNNDTTVWDNTHDAFSDYTLAMVICAAIVILILYFMNASLMKKRVRELSLLKGIGMTGAQIVWMVLISVTLISFCAVVSGLITEMIFAECAAVFVQSTFHFGSTSQYVQDPLQITGCGLLIILFALAGAYVPVLRAEQNALSGSFSTGNHRGGHRKRLRFLGLGRLALDNLMSTKSICIGALFFAAMMGFLLSQANKTIEIYSSAEGFKPVLFSSRHAAVRMASEPTEDEILEGLPCTREIYRFKQDGDGIIELCGGHERQIADSPGWVIAADEQFTENADIEGRLPAKDDEVLLFLECAEIVEPGEYLGHTGYFCTGKYISIGEKVICNTQEYTVTGIVMPNETMKVPVSFSYGPNDTVDVPDYYVPPFMIAITQDAYNELTSKEFIAEYLVYENSDDSLYLMNELYRRGADIDNFNLSDGYVLYAEQNRTSLNVHLSTGMLAVPMLFGLIVFSLLQYSFMHASADDVIIQRALGMTREQILQREMIKALFMTCTAAVLLILLFIYAYAVSGTWSLNILTLITFITFCLLFFTAMYMIPVQEILKRDYENLREE